MNLLVVGGLFVIGVIALVALFFVIRSGPAREESTGLVAPPVPTEQELPEADTDTNTTSTASSTIQTASVSNTDTTSISDERPAATWHPLANGQFYEMKNELHSLHGQAQELERRIGNLVDIVERIEQTQNGSFPIEGQPSASPGAQAR